MLNTKIHLAKSPTFAHHKDIADICAPLFLNSIYYILNFIRLYDSGNALYLSDNLHWIKYYLTHGYPAIGAFEQNTKFRQQDFVVWDALNESDPIVIYSRELFNIKFGVTLIRRFEGGVDFFNFGTTQNDISVLGKLTHQRQVLDQFIDEFYVKARKILNQSQNKLFYLPDFEIKRVFDPQDKLYLGPQFDYQYLTQKELQCAKDLIKGMTIPQIAALRNLSARTMEKHVENMKSKLNCRSQLELGYKLALLGIESGNNT